VVANVVVPSPDYVRFATHYRLRPDFCHAADPESEGIVENLVGYAKDDLLAPLELDDDPWAGGWLHSTPAQACGGEVDGRRPSEIHAIPTERLESERELLAELPSLRLEVGPKPTTRKVDKLSCIRFGSARYSVPIGGVLRYAGEQLDSDLIKGFPSSGCSSCRRHVKEIPCRPEMRHRSRVAGRPEWCSIAA